MAVDIQKIKDQVLQYSDQLEQVKTEVRKALIGQDLMLSRLLIALLTGGHVLLEGVPGLAKTTATGAQLGGRDPLQVQLASNLHLTCFRPT